MDVLLVFAKVPTPGTVKTRLAPALGFEGAARLYTAMMADSLATYAGLGVEVWLCLAPSSQPLPAGLLPAGVEVRTQRGPDLGERLAAAFADAFAAGARRAVVIGTDHPTLPTSLLASAFEGLRSDDALTVVPASDGGFVLLGLARPSASVFLGPSYSHDRVLDDTLTAARRAGLTPTVLDPWYDVDTPEDLDRLRADLAAAPDAAPLTRAALAGLDRDPA